MDPKIMTLAEAEPETPLWSNTNFCHQNSDFLAHEQTLSPKQSLPHGLFIYLHLTKVEGIPKASFFLSCLKFLTSSMKKLLVLWRGPNSVQQALCRKVCTVTYSSLNLRQNKPVSLINMRRGNAGNEASG